MIYTSRYTNPILATCEYNVVGITRTLPKFALSYVLLGNINEIAPPWSLFNVHDRAQFTPLYNRHLDRCGISKISSAIRAYESQCKDTVLCCYEDVRKSGVWCHRLVFAEWWKDKTGEVITELPCTLREAASAEKLSNISELNVLDENTHQLGFDMG